MDKRNPDEQSQEDPEMLPEYDFSKGVRGKHHEEYLEGHTVRVHKADGTVTEQHFTSEPDATIPDEVCHNE